MTRIYKIINSIYHYVAPFPLFISTGLSVTFECIPKTFEVQQFLEACVDTISCLIISVEVFLTKSFF